MAIELNPFEQLTGGYTHPATANNYRSELLLDRIAVAAMQAYIAKGEPGDIAVKAYDVAQSMIALRVKRLAQIGKQITEAQTQRDQRQP